MSYTNGLDKPSDYFNTKLYTGNGSTQSISGVNFTPDFVWLKKRSAIKDHSLNDSVRGAGKDLICNETFSEQNDNVLTSFDSDGFTLSSETRGNESSSTYASWSWLGGGTASSNTDGSITSSVSANQDAGFSIVSYTGTGSNATVGHGLGAEAKCIIVKDRDNTRDWGFYHVSLGNGHYMNLNAAGGSSATSTHWNNTTPTSSVFSIGTSNQVNVSSTDFIAYCFAEKQGYSKFGSYTGNGQDTPNGVFTYLGFTPAFILIKATDINSWVIVDNKRPADSNPVDNSLAADSNAAETTGDINTTFDFLSNGFRTNGNSGNNNSSGQEYIYMAFAENPFVTSTGVPATAR